MPKDASDVDRIRALLGDGIHASANAYGQSLQESLKQELSGQLPPDYLKASVDAYADSLSGAGVGKPVELGIPRDPAAWRTREKEIQQQQWMEQAADNARALRAPFEHAQKREREERAHQKEMHELAKRQAEASEAALEAERQRTAVALEDARAAREEARIARSHMRTSLWLAAASLIVAAWTIIKDQPFW